MTHLYVGLLSGTSVDCVDAGLFELTETQKGIDAKLLASHQHPYPPEIREAVLRISTPGDNEIDRMGSLDIALGQVFAQAVNDLLKESNTPHDSVRAIGSHGQTVRHRPNTKYPFTLQIADPNTIAYESGITTVADFRRKDMAAGGQGAPLAPAFHQAVFSSPNEKRCIVNIGGIANISVLHELTDQVVGYDCGPGNILMDSWVQSHKMQDYDEKGTWAQSGEVDTRFLNELLDHPFLAKAFPKSTGREDFNRTWIDHILSQLHPIAAEDIQATLCEFTAKTIAYAIKLHDIDNVYVCGGGAHNTYLLSRIEANLENTPVSTTCDLNIPPDWVEAGLFAWLAKQRMDAAPGNLPSVTAAAKTVVLGGVYLP